MIGNVTDSGVTDTAASITWTTDENSDSLVVWGPVKPPANQSAGNPSTTSHSVSLGGLSQCTAYFYEVRSTDAASNVARADNGGTWYAFETLGDFGQGLQPCHQGRLTLGKDVLACSDSVELRLVDMDLNLSSVAVDTAIAWAGSTTESTPERIVLTETGPNTSTFTAVVPVAQGAPLAGDGIVQIAHGGTFTARYEDGNDGTGSSRLAFDTAVDDCAGAGLFGIKVTTIEDDSAVVQWTTSEPTTGAVDWGISPALGSTVSDPILSTSHQLALGPLAECGRVHFRVRSTDAYGNQSVADGQGTPFAFNAGMIPGVFRDGFETTTGWTLQGEWQIGAPQGKGSAPGDPTAAFAETKVLGHDLTGLGTRPGDYERGVTEQVISPAINAAGLANPQLKFRRWLNVSPGGIARIKVRTSSNTWVEAWNSSTESPAGITENAWTLAHDPAPRQREPRQPGGDVRAVRRTRNGRDRRRLDARPGHRQERQHGRVRRLRQLRRRAGLRRPDRGAGHRRLRRHRDRSHLARSAVVGHRPRRHLRDLPGHETGHRVRRRASRRRRRRRHQLDRRGGPQRPGPLLRRPCGERRDVRQRAQQSRTGRRQHRRQLRGPGCDQPGHPGGHRHAVGDAAQRGAPAARLAGRRRRERASGCSAR